MKTVKWRSPSNIALVKYWGKYEDQIPANPSVSFTLSACHTDTQLKLSSRKSSDEFDFDVVLDGARQDSFKPKILTFLNRLGDQVEFIKDYHLEINTTNSFPHSSGIASSASGMSALALCLLSLKEDLDPANGGDFFQTASRWARLGSGSACRSLYGGLVEWGEYNGLQHSSNEYGISLDLAQYQGFEGFCDYVLLVEKGEKSVSSSVGHNLMNDHPFAERRFRQAHENLSALLESMKKGDVESFGTLVESEALTLHAMMMTSQPYFLLMKPNTLKVIDLIWKYRRDTGHPIYFTLDAGANIHMLFPGEIEQFAKEFVESELKTYLKEGQYICDRVGSGPEKLQAYE